MNVDHELIRSARTGGSLFLGSLGSGLGDLARASSSLLNGLDDTNSDGLTHVTDGETTQRGVVGESLNAHGLGGNHLDDGGVTGLDELGGVLNRLSGTAVNLLEELGELASNVGGVAVKDWCVTGTDLTRVVQDNDLGIERSGTQGRVVLGVTGNVATTNLLDGDVLDVEADVVTGHTLSELLVVHLDGLDFSGDVGGSEGNDHTGLKDTSLDTADGHSSNTTDLVDVLEGQTQGLLGGTLGGLNRVNGVEEGGTLDLVLAVLGELGPALVPGSVGGLLQHVVAVEARDGDEGNGLGVVADLLDEGRCLLDDFLVTLLLPASSVHLVDGNNELLDTKGIGEQGVFTSLAILGNTSLELTSTGGNDENGAVGLGSTGDHVLDEITVTGSVWIGIRLARVIVISRKANAHTNDGDIVLGSLELPQSNVDGDTTLTLGLELVKDPCVLEGTLTELSGCSDNLVSVIGLANLSVKDIGDVREASVVGHAYQEIEVIKPRTNIQSVRPAGKNGWMDRRTKQAAT